MGVLRTERVSITASVRICSAIPVADQYQVTNDKPLSAFKDIIVVDNLQFTKPSVPSNTVLLAPSTLYQLVTYSLCGGASGISVSRRREELCRRCLVVVRPVAYIMASVLPQGWKAEGTLDKIPRGASVSMEISSHNRLSRASQSSHLDLDLFPNRFDLVRVVPGTWIFCVGNNFSS